MSRHLTLIQQNDTHAHLESHWEIGWRDGRPAVWRAGGYARIRALAERIRAEVRGACMHVDSGDAIHGTGPAQWTEGAAVVPALNAVGVEVMVPGNWEFGFGPSVLRERVRELAFPVIASNVFSAETSAAEFASWKLMEVGGLRVAFVGITSPVVSRTMPSAFGSGLRFADALDVLPDTMAAVRDRERPDLVVLVSHYGLPQEVAIARAVEGVDVILGGHTHDVLAAPVIVGRTIITQSGAHGSYLTRLDLEVLNGRVCDYGHRLIAVRESPDDAGDGTVADIVAESLRPHRERLDEVVGDTRVILHRGAALESPMDNLLTAAYRASTDADVALSHGWRYGAPISVGPITAGDLWQMIPTNPELFTMRLAGAELRRMLEQSLERAFSADPFRQQGGYVIRFSGMRALVRLNNPAGARVIRLEIGGGEARPKREYTVAAAGGLGTRNRESRTPTGMRAIDSLRAYLAKHRPVQEVDFRPSILPV